jgi:hypothetical protein
LDQELKLALFPVLGVWRMQDWKNGIQDRRQVAKQFIIFISSLQACCHTRKIEIVVGNYGNVMSHPDIIAVHMPDCHINCPSRPNRARDD